MLVQMIKQKLLSNLVQLEQVYVVHIHVKVLYKSYSNNLCFIFIILSGPPVREPALNEDERKHLMLMEHRRREEIKRLLEDNDDNYLNQVQFSQ